MAQRLSRQSKASMTVEKPTGKGGLPAHWQRGRLRAALATLLVALAFTYALRGLGRADRLDNWWLRARFTVRERLRPPAPPDPAIVLIRMDDRSLDQWPEPTIAW